MSKLALFGGEPVRTKPFHSWPVYGEEESSNLNNVLKKSKWGVGKRTGVINEFENNFAEYHGVKSAVACTNCTQALEISLSCSEIEAGDEVIVPAYSFVATASAPAKIGAVPVFADIDKESLLIDIDSVERVITNKTRAIIPVHFAGQMADMLRIKELADKYGLAVIEDSAQAHGARRGGMCPGTLNPATFSFQYSKNMTAGEGGIIVGNNEEFIDKCWEHIWHGRKKGGLWYEHFETTSNYRMTEWSAAVLLAQLGRLKEQTKRRMENAEYLSNLLNLDGFLIPASVCGDVEVHSCHLFLMRINRDLFPEVSKTRLVEALAAEGLPIMPGYRFPLYRNPAFQNGNWGIPGVHKSVDYRNVYLPGVERACEDTVWFIHNVLLGEKEDMEDIASGIRKVFESINEL